ncbi:hypothetical protein [Streptosporangium sp. KLBMP 9127]|nr:hypothetical protein [Streptosporangium sp. KLBMP 9127]
MSGETVQLSAEWAIEGKQPGSLDDYGILACSQGQLGHNDFAKIKTRYTTGTPEELPQVTLAWVGGGENTRLVLAIQEWSDQEDRTGRQIAVTRYFCVPYSQVAAQPVSYEALYLALDRSPLPAADPLTFSVPRLDPAAIAARIDGTAIGAAALLLTDQHVCVLRGESLPLLDRLRFLDTVAALLPYGMRTKLTAATWTSSTAEHKIKVSFARHVPEGTHSIIWGGLARVPTKAYDVGHYLDLLLHCSRYTELVGWLAAAGEPLAFQPSGVTKALATLAAFHVPSRSGDVTVAIANPVDHYSVEALLNECADLVPQGQSLRLTAILDGLARQAGARGNAATRDEQVHYRKIIRERRLLEGDRGLPESLHLQLCGVILAVGYGPKLVFEDMRRIFQDFAPTSVLMAAMVRMPAEPLVALTLAARLGPETLTMVLDALGTACLVELAAREPHDPLLVQVICDELVRRGSNGAEDPDIAMTLREHRYLVDAVQALHPDRVEVQFVLLRKLLKAAYGPSLHRREFEEVVGDPPDFGSPPLMAAAITLHGPGAGEIILTSVADRLRGARLPHDTMRMVETYLSQPASAEPLPEPRGRLSPWARLTHGRPRSRKSAQTAIPVRTLYTLLAVFIALSIIEFIALLPIAQR